MVFPPGEFIDVAAGPRRAAGVGGQLWERSEWQREGRRGGNRKAGSSLQRGEIFLLKGGENIGSMSLLGNRHLNVVGVPKSLKVRKTVARHAAETRAGVAPDSTRSCTRLMSRSGNHLRDIGRRSHLQLPTN